MVSGMKNKMVDITHSLKMSEKLISAKILYQQQMYGWGGATLPDTLEHYYNTISVFLGQCLG